MAAKYQIILPSQQFKLRFLDKYMEGHKGFVAGGCFKNLFTGGKIKDVDIFFESGEDFSSAKAFFLGKEAEWGIVYEIEGRVISFKNKETGIRIELIETFFGKPEEILNRFDFTLAKVAYTKDEATGEFKALVHEKFFEHLMTKKLVTDDNIPYPVSTFNRMLRYVSYGFKPCTETKKRLLEEIQRVPNIIMPNDFYAGVD